MKKSISVLVGDNTFGFGTQIAEYLKGRGINAYTRRNDCESILSDIVESAPDVVLVYAGSHHGDTEMLLNRIYKINDKIKIIVVSPYEFENMKEKFQPDAVSDFLFMPVTPFDIYCCITRNVVAGDDITPFEERIMEFLLKNHIKPHLKGYMYIMYAIECCIYDITFAGNILGRLYPKIAEKYKTTSSNVERSIRHVVEMYCDNTKFNNKNTTLKLTNSELIVKFADEFCYKYEILFKSK